MKKSLLNFALIAVLAALQPAGAAVQFEPEKKTSPAEREAAEFEKMAQTFVGKTYWYEPRPDVSDFSRLKFKESLPSAEKSAYDNYNAPTFRPTEKVAFSVTNVFVFRHQKETWRSPEYYAEISFEGGKVGYLQIEHSTIPPFKVYDPENSFSAKYHEVVYTDDPDLVRKRERDAAAAEERKRIAAEKAWQARGGVRVGMTKKQVLASNWGEPEHVNRTSNSRGTTEQWVYGGGNYLYFTNGVLTTIQN